MLGYYYLILTTLAVAMCLTYFFCRKKISNKIDIVLKVVSLILAFIFLVRYLWENEALQGVIGHVPQMPDALRLGLHDVERGACGGGCSRRVAGTEYV